MNDHRWLEPDGHISTAMLMLYLDGEVEGEQQVAVAKHLQQCWTCRERMDWLNRGVLTFLDYYRNVLVAGLPPASHEPGGLRVLHQELARPVETVKFHARWKRLLQKTARVPVPAWITAAASLLACIVLPFLSVVEPAHLTAKEFLQRVCDRSAASTGKANLAKRRVRIRRGKQVFDRKLVTTSIGKAPADQPASKPDPETLAALKLADVDWENPLNPLDFAAWHRAAAEPRDVIRESQTSITLETTLPGDAAVRFVSFTVSREDWHPTSHHIEFPDQPAVDIDELPWEPEPASVAARNTPHAAVPSAPRVPDGPTEEELDTTEVQVREVLHQLKADFTAAPVIRREPGQVTLRALASSEGERIRIVDALEGIPYLSQSVFTPRSTQAAEGNAEQQQPGRPVAKAARAPLADNLRRYCGGLDQANSYLAVMAESYSDTLMAASALSDLAKRYSDADWNRLSPDLQSRLGKLVDDYESRLLRGARAYDALSSPVLDAMLHDMNVQPAGPALPPATCCLSWREKAPAVSEQVKRIQSILTRLFAGTSAEGVSSGASTEALLAVCDQARNQLKWWLQLSSRTAPSPGRVP